VTLSCIKFNKIRDKRPEGKREDVTIMLTDGDMLAKDEAGPRSVPPLKMGTFLEEPRGWAEECPPAQRRGHSLKRMGLG